MDFSKLLVIVAIGAVAVVLFMGLWNMMKGGSPSRAQNLMRWRVLLQAIAIGVILLVLWIAGR
jgi:hypothetical protein